MKLILIAAIALCNIFADKGMKDSETEKECITEDQVIKPVINWTILSRQIKIISDTSFISIKSHNPLNKKDLSLVDAEFLMVQTGPPEDADNINVILAIYHNKNNTVTFKRIYKIQKIKGADSKNVGPLTECFSREVITNVSDNNKQDGGIKD